MHFRSKSAAADNAAATVLQVGNPAYEESLVVGEIEYCTLLSTSRARCTKALTRMPAPTKPVGPGTSRWTAPTPAMASQLHLRWEHLRSNSTRIRFDAPGGRGTDQHYVARSRL